MSFEAVLFEVEDYKFEHEKKKKKILIFECQPGHSGMLGPVFSWYFTAMKLNGNYILLGTKQACLNPVEDRITYQG